MEQALTEACVLARAEIHRFLAGQGRGVKSKALREHLARCPACNDEYRSLVEGVARISRGARESDGDVDEPTRVQHTRRNLIAGDPRRRFRLPKSILPLVLVAVFAVLITRAGTDHVVVRALAGGVYKGSTTLEPGSSAAASNGDGCSTGADGRANIEFGAHAIHFEPDSSFLVERLDQLAVRMFDGRARVEGDALVMLVGGALQSRGGEARIAIDDQGISIASLRGTIEYTDAGGRQVIAPGETRRFQHQRMAVEHD